MDYHSNSGNCLRNLYIREKGIHCKSSLIILTFLISFLLEMKKWVDIKWEMK